MRTKLTLGEEEQHQQLNSELQLDPLRKPLFGGWTENIGNSQTRENPSNLVCVFSITQKSLLRGNESGWVCGWLLPPHP